MIYSRCQFSIEIERIGITLLRVTSSLYRKEVKIKIWMLVRLLKNI